MTRLLPILFFAGCGATSRSATDADSDADTDADADADLDCSSHGGLVGPVPLQSCGPPAPRSDIQLCNDEIGPCERDEQCQVVNFDACCGLAAVAVIEPAVEGVQARIEPCDVTDPGCTECPQPPSEGRCEGGQCILVDCMGPCL